MKKPGPKTGKAGKKKTYSFTLSAKAYRKLQMIASLQTVSASKWIETKILESF